jgi:hypothetical protein
LRHRAKFAPIRCALAPRFDARFAARSRRDLREAHKL